MSAYSMQLAQIAQQMENLLAKAQNLQETHEAYMTQNPNNPPADEYRDAVQGLRAAFMALAAATVEYV